MPDRKYKYQITGTSDTSKVVLGAKGDFDKLNTSLGNTQTTAGRLSSSIATGLGVLGAQAVGAGIRAGKRVIGETIETYKDFEAQMNILKVAARDLGEEDLARLDDVTKAVGYDTELFGITSSEAAEALTNFYKANLKTADIFGGPSGMIDYLEKGTSLGGAFRAAIDLAAASDLDLAKASELVVETMTSFNIPAEDAVKIVDSFVQTADAAVGEVSDYAAAMVNVGNVVAPFYRETQDGLTTLEELNAALALLDQRGMRGAEAGTALRSMFMNMMRSTKRSEMAMNDLDVALYNTREELEPIPDLIAQISEGAMVIDFEGMDQETIDQLALMSRQIAALRKTAMDPFKIEAAAVAAKQMAELRKEMEHIIDPTKEGGEAVGTLTEQMRNLAAKDVAGTYGIRAFLALAMAGGEGYQEMAQDIENAATTQEQAIARTQGLSGQLEILQGTVESFMLIAGKPLVEGFLTPLVQKGIEIGEKVLPAFSDLIAILSGEEMEDASKTIQLIAQLHDDVDGLKEAGIELKDAWLELKQAFGLAKDETAESADSITFLQSAIKGLSDLRQTALDPLVHSIRAVAALFRGEFKVALEEASLAATQLPTATGIAKEVTEETVEVLTGAEFDFGEKARELATKILGPLAGIDMKAETEKMVSDAAAGLEDPSGTIKAEAQARADEILAPITKLTGTATEGGTTAAGEAKAIIGDVRLGLMDPTGVVKTEAEARAADITDPIAGVDLTDEGTSIISGLKSGLSKAWDDLGISEWWSARTKQFEGIIRKETETESPSRVMMEIGEDIPAGLGIGMANGMPLVQEPVKNVMSLFDRMAMWLKEFAKGLGVRGLHDTAEAIEEYGDALKDLGTAFNQMVQAAAGAEGLEPEQLLFWLDQFVWFAEEAGKRFRVVYKKHGGERLRKAADIARWLGDTINGIAQNLGDIKPGEWPDLYLAMDQLEWLAVRAGKLVRNVVEGPEGLGTSDLEDLATWSGHLVGIMAIADQNLSTFEARETEDFAGDAETFLTQVATFARLAKDKWSGMEPELLKAYKEAEEATGYIKGLIDLAGVSMAIEVPEADPTALYETHLDNLALFAGKAKDKFKGITGDLLKDYEAAAEATDLIVSIMGVYGVELKAQLPDPDFEKNLEPHLAALDRLFNPAQGDSLPARINAIVPSARDALEDASEAVDLISGVMGIFAFELKASLPDPDFDASIEPHLIAMERLIRPATGKSLQDRILDMVGDAREALEAANEGVDLIVGVFGIFGPQLKAELPDPDFEKNIEPHLDAMDRLMDPSQGRSLPQRILEMAENAGEALETADEAVDRIVNIFSILDVGLAEGIETGKDPLQAAIDRLAYAEATAPLIWEALDRIMEGLTLPAGYEGTKEELLAKYAELSGLLHDMFGVLGVQSIMQDLEEEKPAKSMTDIVQETMDDLEASVPILTSGLDRVREGYADALTRVEPISESIKGVFGNIAEAMGYIHDILYDEELSLEDLPILFDQFIRFLNAPGLLPVLAGASLYQGPLPGLPSVQQTMAEVPTLPVRGGGTKILEVVIRKEGEEDYMTRIEVIEEMDRYLAEVAI